MTGTKLHLFPTESRNIWDILHTLDQDFTVFNIWTRTLLPAQLFPAYNTCSRKARAPSSLPLQPGTAFPPFSLFLVPPILQDCWLYTSTLNSSFSRPGLPTLPTTANLAPAQQGQLKALLVKNLLLENFFRKYWNNLHGKNIIFLVFLYAYFVIYCCTYIQLPSGGHHWRKRWQPTPVFLPGEFHGQREPWQATVSMSRIRLSNWRIYIYTYNLIPGEGNGNALQYSCLENLMDRGACQAMVHGVAESDTTEVTEHARGQPTYIEH